MDVLKKRLALFCAILLLLVALASCGTKTEKPKSTESNSCRLKVADDAVDIMVEEKGETLAVDIVRGEQPTAQIVLTADRILIRGCSSIEYVIGAPDRPVKIGADGLKFVRNGFAYMVGIDGTILPTATGCKIQQVNNCISFCMN